MRKIAGYLTKNRSEKDQKIAQSTHENEHIKPRKTFWRNSKQLLRFLSSNARGHAQRGPDSGENGDKGLNHDAPDVFLFHSF